MPEGINYHFVKMPYEVGGDTKYVMLQELIFRFLF